MSPASQCTPSVSVTVDAKSWAREVMATCMGIGLRRLQGLAFFLTRLLSDQRRVGKAAVLYKHQFSLPLPPSPSLVHTQMDTAHTSPGMWPILYMLYTSTLIILDLKQEIEIHCI